MSEVTLVEKEEFEGFIQKLSKSLNTFQVQVLTEEQHTFNIKELYRFQYIPSKGIAIQIINSFSWFKIIYLYLKCNKWYGSFLFIYKSILFKQYCFYIQGFNRFSPGMIFVGEHQLMIVEKNKTHVYQCVVLGGDKEVFQNDLNTRLWLLSNTLVNIPSIIELDRDQCFFVSSWIQGRLVQSIRKLSQPQQINLWQQLATVYKSKPLFQQHIDAFLACESSRWDQIQETSPNLVEGIDFNGMVQKINTFYSRFSPSIPPCIYKSHIVHGDLYLSNNVLSNAQDIWLLDWADSGEASIIYDAVYLLIFDQFKYPQTSNQILLAFCEGRGMYPVWEESINIRMTNEERKIHILAAILEVIVRRADKFANRFSFGKKLDFADRYKRQLIEIGNIFDMIFHNNIDCDGDQNITQHSARITECI